MNKNSLYLKSLTLNNFATFKNQEITFDEGMNVIIGETGSGKSLIFEALQIILGYRADKKYIRRDAEFAVLEATFHCEDSEIKTFLESEGYPAEDNEIVVKRIISPDKTKNFLNFQACPLQVISSFAKRFVDFVGQFENQKLLSDNYQIKLLDNFSALSHDLKSYQADYSLYLQLKQTKEELKNPAELELKKEFLVHQIDELKKLNPSVTNEKELNEIKNQILNAEKIQKSMNTIENLINGGDSHEGVLTSLKKVAKLSSELNTYRNDLDLSQVTEAITLIEDFSFKISRTSGVEHESMDLNTVMEKLDQYQKIKRKFNKTTEEIVELADSLQLELKTIEEKQKQSSEIDSQIQLKLDQCMNKAKKLHEQRQKFAKKLSQLITEKIQKLNMKGAEINIALAEKDELNEYGFTQINFMAQTNPGEGFFKIKETASGGELSRILLALRTLLTSKDSISVFLFDKIDTGLGGETAQTIGKSLRDISESSQVITITHLPQIAYFAEEIIVVEKNLSKEQESTRTLSTAKVLKGGQMKKEVQNLFALIQ